MLGGGTRFFPSLFPLRSHAAGSYNVFLSRIASFPKLGYTYRDCLFMTQRPICSAAAASFSGGGHYLPLPPSPSSHLRFPALVFILWVRPYIRAPVFFFVLGRAQVCGGGAGAGFELRRGGRARRHRCVRWPVRPGDL